MDFPFLTCNLSAGRSVFYSVYRSISRNIFSVPLLMKPFKNSETFFVGNIEILIILGPLNFPIL